MKLSSVKGALVSPLAASLEDFEREFSYPLGEVSRFRISHQPDYLRFFQAIGEAELLVAENGSEVQASLVTVERRLCFNGRPFAAHYFCDLKVRPGARGSRVLTRLFGATQTRIRASRSLCCYGIVMSGTARLPSDYTGRLGIPAFQEIAGIAILRLSGRGSLSGGLQQVNPQQFASIFTEMERPGYVATGGDRSLRSSIVPVHLTAMDGSACGVLEDTRLAKRLLLDGGEEMLSAHLSSFAFKKVESGAVLLGHALALARERGLPALFVAVPASHVAPLLAGLSDVDVTVAPALVFGHDLETGHDWWVDTAEI